MKRLYFLLPDVACARAVVQDLLLGRINDRHLHVLARRGTDLGDLREANYLQKSDIKHSAMCGLVCGGAVGFLFGLWMVVSPPDGIHMELVTMLFSTVGGSIFGAWASSLVGASTPNSSLQQFSSEIDAGKILVMADVPRSRIDEVHEMIGLRHPEADVRGIEPLIPAFP